MTPKERAAMQQALEYLKGTKTVFTEDEELDEAITALREALVEQAEQVPVGEVDCIYDDKAFAIHMTGDVVEGQKLYAAPVRTKDLTDALKHYADTYCEGWCKETGGTFEDCGGCKARAVIAADREKNK